MRASFPFYSRRYNIRIIISKKHDLIMELENIYLIKVTVLVTPMKGRFNVKLNEGQLTAALR